MSTSENMRQFINLIENSNKSHFENNDDLYDWWNTIRYAMSSMASWNSGQYEPNEKLWTICMENLPDARYTGMMYRGITLPTIDLKTATIQELLPNIKQYLNSHKRQIVGWSKSINVAGKFASPFGIILAQNSTGLDLNNLYHEDSDYSVEPAFPSEQEVLAYTSPDVQLYGFSIIDEYDRITFYTSDKFIEFQKQIQSIE